jgi:hypothetical protein
MAFSADGKRLACGTQDGKVIVWDVASGQVVTVIDTQSDIFCSRVLFSPDGTHLHTVNGRNEARLWNAATGEPCSTTMYGVDEASFSADGRWFSSMGTFGMQIRDGKNGTLVSEISRREGFVLLSPTGGRVGISVDGNAQVWDILTGQPVTDVMRECGGVFDWSLDGRYVLTGHGIIKVFSVPPPLPEGTPIPPWLLQLATICGARRVNEAGQCVDAPEVAGQIGDVRRQLAALPDDSPYVEWGRWFLDDSPTRSIAPGFTITPAEADKLAAEGAPPATQNEH